MEISETPPKGERAAACIWNRQAFTKSDELVPRALFRRSHQISLSPSGGRTFAMRPFASRIFTRTGGRRCPAAKIGVLVGPFIIRLFRPWHRRARRSGAISVRRSPRPSNRQTCSFHSRHRLARQDSGRRAVGNAYGPVGQGVGTANRRGSLPHNEGRSSDSEVVFRRAGPWGCLRFSTRPSDRAPASSVPLSLPNISYEPPSATQ
jgi:hypothetical protein